MPVPISDLLWQVREELNDPIKPPKTDGVFWSNRALFGHVNKGIAACAQFDDTTAVVNASSQLTQGTKQTLPPDALALKRITRNMGTEGTIPGRRITTVDVEDLVAFRPNFDEDPPQQEIRHAMADPSDPRRWTNWPPSDGTGWVEQIYAQVPDNVSAEFLPASAGASAGSFTIQLSSTYGINVGQAVGNLTNPTCFAPPVGPDFLPYCTVESLVPNSSVTLTQPILANVSASDVMIFSDVLPVPDVYEDPVFLWTVAHALAKNTARQNLPKAFQLIQLFGTMISADETTMSRFRIGMVSQ